MKTEERKEGRREGKGRGEKRWERRERVEGKKGEERNLSMEQSEEVVLLTKLNDCEYRLLPNLKSK